MPNKRTTIWLTDAAQAVVSRAWSVSGEINRCVIAYGRFCDAVGADPTKPASEDAILSALARYRQCWQACIPALSRSEWLLICDALNGTWCSGAATQTDIARVLDAEIAATAQDGLGEKWGVDVRALSQRLAAMSFCARAAVVEVVNAFWREAGNALIDHDALLARAGARLT
ncbi:hypothetical protein [Immundisolibacter sp.]